MKRSGVVVGVMVGLAVSALAEFRTWTDQKGNQIEAEFARVSGKSIVLQKKDGKKLTVPPTLLSDDDQEYLWGKVPEDLLNPAKSVLERETPPRMEIKASKIMDRRKTGYDQVDCDLKYEIMIRKKSAPEYSRKLKAVLYVLGISKEHEYYVMLDKKEFEFDFNQTSTVELSGNEVGITHYQSQNYGVEPKGYLVVVTDDEGNELQVQGSSNKFEGAKDNIAKFHRKDVFTQSFVKKERWIAEPYIR